MFKATDFVVVGTVIELQTFDGETNVRVEVCHLHYRNVKDDYVSCDVVVLGGEDSGVRKVELYNVDHGTTGEDAWRFVEMATASPIPVPVLFPFLLPPAKTTFLQACSLVSGVALNWAISIFLINLVVLWWRASSTGVCVQRAL